MIFNCTSQVRVPSQFVMPITVVIGQVFRESLSCHCHWYLSCDSESLLGSPKRVEKQLDVHVSCYVTAWAERQQGETIQKIHPEEK